MTNENIDTPTPDEGTTTRPIGFWLRVVDAKISEQFDEAFAPEGVSRRDWMLLSMLDGDAAHPAFAERIARKAARGGRGRGGKRLAELEERGWISRTDEGWTLTDEGRAAKERLGATVAEIRSRVAAAVTPEQFDTTLASLEAIARELGWDESQPLPRRRGPFGRRGFGPGMHRGFSPEHGHGHDHGHRHGGHGHHEHPGAHGHGHGHGHGGCGHHEHPGAHGHRGHSRRTERAYERGFDAGFSKARVADGTSPVS